MNDLISREVAINYLTKARIVGDSRPMTEIFAEIPSANQWIPCSEAMPQRGEEVLITYRDIETSEIGVEISSFKDISNMPNSGGDWASPFGACNFCFDVIAWQPLPEPYVEVEDESN